MPIFEIGDFVVYGGVGVCETINISKKKLTEMMAERLYYTFDPVYETGVIYAPVENKLNVLRPVISKEEANQLIDQIPQVKLPLLNDMVPNELTKYYNALLTGHDCYDLLELAMLLEVKKTETEKNDKKVTAMDKKLLAQAENLLNGELAVALEISVEEVENYINSRVKNRYYLQ